MEPRADPARKLTRRRSSSRELKPRPAWRRLLCRSERGSRHGITDAGRNPCLFVIAAARIARLRTEKAVIHDSMSRTAALPIAVANDVTSCGESGDTRTSAEDHRPLRSKKELVHGILRFRSQQGVC